MRFILFVLMIFLSRAALAQVDSLGLFEHHRDIGNPKITGSSTYDPVTHTYTLTGSGYNIWFDRDDFNIYSEK
jgi:TolB protein